ncbi:hypothetical protein PHYPSEUDO_002383 [Phytophthora pseudosyringae]|uniref:Uncharacterized protein n=1 Tax=Phytophthora pseudosyringae TaxID=221518 RepID=A0A8T1VXR9_9STRA|nr:hypothetical protein PHYPSEUDO_002383 [Phytophthora pseudosyringae]
MVDIKGPTAQARFDAHVTKHRTWERKSAGLSGCDEKETPFIQVMTGVVSKLDDHLRAQAKAITAAAEAVKAKTDSGDVVRTAALSRIQLDNRRSNISEEKKQGDDLEAQPKVLPRVCVGIRVHIEADIWDEWPLNITCVDHDDGHVFGVADLILKLLRRCYESTSPSTQRHRVPVL